jgi:hypothetical protein
MEAPLPWPTASLCPRNAALLPRRFRLVAMTRSLHPAHGDTIAYHGEVWTDAIGYATVRLPTDAGQLEPPLEYELSDLDPAGTARITAPLEDGRFTIATDQPHVKVAWRITGRQRNRRQEETER